MTDDDSSSSKDGWLEALVRLSDDRFRVPGTNLRFGVDALLGLLPGVGDAASTALAFAVIFVAWREAAPPALLGRMLVNVAADTLVGTVPVLGDWFDLAFRANRRNYVLLTRFRVARSRLPAAEATPAAAPDSGVARRRGSALGFGALALVLALFIVVPVTVTLLLGYWLWS